MTMTGAERQRLYRAKAKTTEGLATLNVLIATAALDRLRRLASASGLNQRQTLERIIGEAFAALLSDAPTPIPETTLLSDAPSLSDEPTPEPLQSDTALPSDEPLLSDTPSRKTSVVNDPEIVRRALALAHLSEKKAAAQLQAEGIQIGPRSVGAIRKRHAGKTASNTTH